MLGMFFSVVVIGYLFVAVFIYVKLNIVFKSTNLLQAYSLSS